MYMKYNLFYVILHLFSNKKLVLKICDFFYKFLPFFYFKSKADDIYINICLSITKNAEISQNIAIDMHTCTQNVSSIFFCTF